MDSKLLEILVCPVSKGPLHYKAEQQELWCRLSRLAYPVKEGLPIMLESEARLLSSEECESLPT